MVIEKIIEDRVYHYSDCGKYIVQNETGIEYIDALDVIPCKYTYSESDNYIEEDATDIDYQNALGRLGVKNDS